MTLRREMKKIKINLDITGKNVIIYHLIQFTVRLLRILPLNNNVTSTCHGFNRNTLLHM